MTWQKEIDGSFNNSDPLAFLLHISHIGTHVLLISLLQKNADELLQLPYNMVLNQDISTLPSLDKNHFKPSDKNEEIIDPLSVQDYLISINGKDSLTKLMNDFLARGYINEEIKAAFCSHSVYSSPNTLFSPATTTTPPSSTDAEVAGVKWSTNGQI